MFNRIKEDVKTAMKNKDVLQRDVLRMVITKAQANYKQKFPTGTDNPTDEMVLAAIQQEIKQLNQTMDALGENKTSTLYVDSAFKKDILSIYLPKMMTLDETIAQVVTLLTDQNVTNVGQAMKIVMPALKGKADNAVIKSAVEQYVNQ